MNRRGRSFGVRPAPWLASGATLVSGGRALACATCFGKSDSALAQGMNMGILTLLIVMGAVMLTLVGFFVFLARRSAAWSRAQRALETSFRS